MIRKTKAVAAMAAIGVLLIWREIDDQIEDARYTANQMADEVFSLRQDLERVERQAEEAERQAEYAVGRADGAAEDAEAARRRSTYGYSPYSYQPYSQRYGW